MVYIVDISASMQGKPLENVKAALLAALSKLNPADTFNIIAFNENSLLFSSSMVTSSKESIGQAIQWIDQNIVAEGSTDISLQLNQVIMTFSSRWLLALTVLSLYPFIYQVNYPKFYRTTHLIL